MKMVFTRRVLQEIFDQISRILVLKVNKVEETTVLIRIFGLIDEVFEENVPGGNLVYQKLFKKALLCNNLSYILRPFLLHTCRMNFAPS